MSFHLGLIISLPLILHLPHKHIQTVQLLEKAKLFIYAQLNPHIIQLFHHLQSHQLLLLLFFLFLNFHIIFLFFFFIFLIITSFNPIQHRHLDLNDPFQLILNKFQIIQLTLNIHLQLNTLHLLNILLNNRMLLKIFNLLLQFLRVKQLFKLFLPLLPLLIHFLYLLKLLLLILLHLIDLALHIQFFHSFPVQTPNNFFLFFFLFFLFSLLETLLPLKQSLSLNFPHTLPNKHIHTLNLKINMSNFLTQLQMLLELLHVLKHYSSQHLLLTHQYAQHPLYTRIL